MLFPFFRITLFSWMILALTACGGGGGSSSGTISSAIVGLTLNGNTLYVANADKQIIQALDLTTLAVTTYAGGAGVSGTANGTGTAARFSEPFSLVYVGTALFVADTYNHGIRKIDSSQNVSTLTGTLGTSGATDGNNSTALFKFPKGITTDGTSLFVADSSNFLIRQVNKTTGAVTALAGTSGQSGYVDGLGAGVKFGAPFAVAATATYVYVSDSSNNSIRSVKISDGTVATVAGSTSGTSGTTDAAGTAARFNDPAGIVSDGANMLYVADRNNHAIRQIDLSTSPATVSTIAGTAGTGNYGPADGTGAAAKFNSPIGLALDTANGFLYVSDQNYTKIRKIVLGTGVVTTLSASF